MGAISNEQMMQLIEKTAESLTNSDFVRRGEPAKVGEDAVEAAKSVENRQMEGQTSLRKDDVFTVPTGELFDKCIITRKFSDRQRNVSVGLLVVVERNGKPYVCQVFSNAFTRGYYLMKGTSKTDHETKMTYPLGDPAQDVRDEQGSLYAALKVLAGKTVKVTNDSRVRVWDIKDGEQIRDGETRFQDDQMEARERRIYSFEYVTPKASGK